MPQLVSMSPIYLFERYKDEVEGLPRAHRKLQNTFADHVGKLDGSFKVMNLKFAFHL